MMDIEEVILSLDPGITTGGAVFDLDGDLLYTFTLSAERILEDSALNLTPKVAEAVIEETPVPTQSKMNKLLGQVLQKIDETFPEAVKITPGEWKTSRFGKEKRETESSVHEQDAVRLGKYYIAYKRS